MTKIGRGRNYVFRLDGSLGAHAHQFAMIEEQSLRVQDLIADLPEDVCNRVPDWGENSIYYLGMHMVGAEDHWLAVTTGNEAQRFGSIKPGQTFTLQEFNEYLQSVRPRSIELVRACLADASVFKPCKQFNALTSVIDHLMWHWIYHSGQIGLLRRFFQKRYKWQFAGPADTD